MTLAELRLKVQQWDSQNNNEAIANSKYTKIMNNLEYHGSNSWNSYYPTEHYDCNSNYMERLAKWIGNVTSEDEQKILLEYAAYISYFSNDDFTALYCTALQREVYPWIIKNLNLRLDVLHQSGNSFDSLLSHVVKSRTWYCPITDSMDINGFYKVNHLSGISERPQFSGLQKQAEHSHESVGYWMNYMEKPNSNSSTCQSLEFIVLLEDIVGSGTQCMKAVRWAVETFNKPVLFIPLILCPNGVAALQSLESECKGNLTVRPIVKLERRDLLGPQREDANDWYLAENMEKFAVDHLDRLRPGIDPFGFKSTGCSIAMYSNTPDNSLPLIHHQSPTGSWDALFPRVYRD